MRRMWGKKIGSTIKVDPCHEKKMIEKEVRTFVLEEVVRSTLYDVCHINIL